MSPTYIPLNDKDADEEDFRESPKRQKKYTQPWAISVIVLLLTTNIITVLYFQTPKSDHAPPDYGSELSNASQRLLVISITG